MNRITKHIWLGGGGDAAKLDKATVVEVFVKESEDRDPRTMDAYLNCTSLNEIEYEMDKPFCRLSVQDGNFIHESYIDRAMDFIAEQVRGDKEVLVHCLGGISRSPSIVACYIAIAHNMDFLKALKYVQKKRCHVDPAVKVMRSMQEYIRNNKEPLPKSELL